MFFRKQKIYSGVAFDIGTAGVSATLFEIRPQDARPHVLKTFRKFHKTSLRRNANHFSKSMTSQFSTLLEDIKLFTQNKMPSVYLVGLSSIFYLGKTEHIYEKLLAGRTITARDIDGFIASARDKFLSGLAEGDVVVFETLLMRSVLNGYVIEQIIGKSATELELWVRFGATSRELYDTFTKIIHSANPNAEIRFSTFPSVSWELMREVYFPAHSALMVDIGGELAEVTFLADGIITEVLSLPFGVMNLLLRISEAERVDLENALSMLRAYTEGVLTKETENHIRAILKKEIKNWEEIFERVWQEAARQTMFDVKMLFLGGGGVVDDLKNAVVPPLLHPNLAKGLSTSVVTPEAFRDKFATFAGFDGPGDFGLMALIIMYISNKTNL